MKVRKRETEILDAEQWFPKKKVPGVMGTGTDKWCGCMIIGGPPMPHIHHSITECELVRPGDWIVTDSKGKKCLVRPNVFDQMYDKV